MEGSSTTPILPRRFSGTVPQSAACHSCSIKRSKSRLPNLELVTRAGYTGWLHRLITQAGYRGWLQRLVTQVGSCHPLPIAAGIKCSDTSYQGVHEYVLGYDGPDGALMFVCTPTEGKERKLTSTFSSLESKVEKVNGKLGEHQSLMT